jgi:hypothetical protein
MRPVLTILVLLIFISLANAQVGLRFSTVQGKFQKIDNVDREPVYGLGIGFYCYKPISTNLFLKPEIGISKSGGELHWINEGKLKAEPFYINFSLPLGYLLPHGLKILTGPRIGAGSHGTFELNNRNKNYSGIIGYERIINSKSTHKYQGLNSEILFLKELNFEWNFEFTYQVKFFGISINHYLGLRNLNHSTEENPNFTLRTRVTSISLSYEWYPNK